jgi:integrase
LIKAFEDFELVDLSRDRLQKFLDQKARSLSRSLVSHLRWDLNAIFKMAAEDAIIEGNPAGSLVTPKEAKTRTQRVMTKEQVRLALSVLDLRERVIFLLAVLAGVRPGEILALRWGKVDPQMIEIAQRVYRGLPDDPKTERGKRQAAISANTTPDALVFPSERGTYLSRDNILRRNKLDDIGLGWVNFQVLRRTQASLGHKAWTRRSLPTKVGMRSESLSIRTL